MRVGEVSAKPAADSSLTVDFATSLAALAALAGPWEGLIANLADHDALFFQSHAWCQLVARVRSARRGDAYRLCVAKVLRNDRLIGIWPLALQRVAGAWIVRKIDEPFGQFAGVAFESAPDVGPGIAAVIKEIKKQRIADGISIEGVVAGSELHTALTAQGLHIADRNDAVYVDLRPFSAYADYLKSINAKTRKNLRNLKNRLSREREVAVVSVSDRSGLHTIIENSFADRVAWLNERGKSSTAFRDADFHAIVTAVPDEHGIQSIGYALTENGHTIAQQWGFIYRGRYYAYISSRDPAFEAFSAGRIHLGEVIKSCHDAGIEVLELMPPIADYKMIWTDKTKRLDTFVAALTPRGFAILNVWLGRVKPGLVKATRLLPSRLRQKIAALANTSE